MKSKIKRTITILIHTAAVILMVGSLCFLQQKALPDKGLSWTQQEDFEESDKFSRMVDGDLTNIRRYVVLKEAFDGYDGEDISNILIVNSENGVVTYTLNEIKAIAAENGCTVNETSGIITMSKTDTASNNYEVKIISKSYDPFYFENVAPGPSQGVIGIKELSIDAMTAYGEYIRLKNLYETGGGNFSYFVYYVNKEDEICSLRNSEKTFSEIQKMSRYVLVLKNGKVVSNISPVPGEFLKAADTFEFGDDDDYIAAAGVDTKYLFEDRYKEAHDNYKAEIQEIYSVMTVFGAALIVSILTMILVIRGFGKEYGKNETFTDKMDLEVLVVTLGFMSMIGYVVLRMTLLKGIFAIVSESEYYFWKETTKALCVYFAALLMFCSFYRRGKNGGLFKNSLLLKIANDAGDIPEIRKTAGKTAREYFSFVIFNVVAVAAGVFCYLKKETGLYFVAMAGICLLIVAIDVYVFAIICAQRKQRILLREALTKISDGETGLTVDEKQYTGGELRMAKGINNISRGLAKALTEQVKAERLKADLITNVSHDIRTPLTSIINYVDLIKREDPQDEKIREYVDVLERKSARLKNLTEDLLEASKASSGNIKLEMQKLDLVELAIQAGGEFDDKMRARGLSLELSTPESPVFVEADGRHLWRVFENLYNNAAKYALENTRVYADVKIEDGNCIFTVKNISKERLNISPEELTERFVRGDSSRTTEGSGLGLSIATSLTKLMGGELIIEIDGDLYKAKVVLKEYVPEAVTDNGDIAISEEKETSENIDTEEIAEKNADKAY